MLYPGWASGSLFFLLLIGVLTALLFLTHSTIQSFIDLAIGFGIMVFPAAMIQLFARHSENRFTIYLTLMMVCAVLTAILTALYLAVGEKLLLWVFGFIPMVLFPLSEELASTGNQGSILFLSLVISGTYLFIVLAGAFPRIAKFSALEEESLAEGDP
jgi:hypothetical protein